MQNSPLQPTRWMSSMVNWFGRNPKQQYRMVEVPLKDLKIASTCGWLAACASSQLGHPHLTPLNIPKGQSKVIAVLKRPTDGSNHPNMVVLDGFDDLDCLAPGTSNGDQICQGIWNLFEMAELTGQRPVDLIRMSLTAGDAKRN